MQSEGSQRQPLAPEERPVGDRGVASHTKAGGFPTEGTVGAQARKPEGRTCSLTGVQGGGGLGVTGLKWEKEEDGVRLRTWERPPPLFVRITGDNSSKALHAGPGPP